MMDTKVRVQRATLKTHGFRPQTAPGNGERFWFFGTGDTPNREGVLVYARSRTSGLPGGEVALHYASSKTRFLSLRHPAKFWASRA
jgi:hypothetical protein